MAYRGPVSARQKAVVPHVLRAATGSCIMSGETYCRENVYSSISLAQRFSLFSDDAAAGAAVSCLSVWPCRSGGGAALPLTWALELFILLIGFFCWGEHKLGVGGGGTTHADVVCNQSRAPIYLGITWRQYITLLSHCSLPVSELNDTQITHL